ncbi:hypothetical protein OBBRIDRAFT_834300 [Obba rivulosa]|uniref:Uncharacterized protein n=1 Tax=Obba rivulosa TaxID=1052685 RepID=A0A8E2AY88_9APHY|nr:hypothetical protein OBBRIDRAFT_834300 [Obba rivulosa]
MRSVLSHLTNEGDSTRPARRKIPEPNEARRSGYALRACVRKNLGIPLSDTGEESLSNISLLSDNEHSPEDEEKRELKAALAGYSRACRNHRAQLRGQASTIQERDAEIVRLQELLRVQIDRVKELEEEQWQERERAQAVIEQASTILAGFSKKRTAAEQSRDDDELEYVNGVPPKKCKVEDIDEPSSSK